MDISEVEETLFMIGDAKVHTQHILNTFVYFFVLYFDFLVYKNAGQT